MKKILFLLFLPVFLFFNFPDTDVKVRAGKDFALFIAVQDYDYWNDLRNPVSDAQALAKELQEEYNFATEVVINPKRNEIYAALEKYRTLNYGEDNQLFIFISGHGDFREGTGEGFFIPKDGLLEDPFQDTYIPHTRLERIVDNIPCNHILLAIDACYSGTFDEDIALSKSRPTGTLTNMDNQLFITRSLKPRSRLFLTSGGKERTPDGKNYSPFTEQLLIGLRSYGINDNVLTFTELQGFMEVANPKPHSGGFGTNEPGGNFLFIAGKGNTSTFTPPVRNEPSTSNRPHIATTVADPQNAILYPIKSLNGQQWMLQNLNTPTPNSVCYQKEESYCEKYGRLYEYEDAVKACQSLGKGWHLPSGEEWRAMIKVYGGVDKDSDDKGQKAATQLTAGGESGFNAVFGGMKVYSSDFQNVGRLGNYWTSSFDKNLNHLSITFSSNGSILYQTTAKGKKIAFSCRCVKD